MTTDEKITFLQVFVGGQKIRDDQLGVVVFENVQKALYDLFHIEEVQQQSYARNPEALVPKKDQKADQNTLEIGRKLGWEKIEMM